MYCTAQAKASQLEALGLNAPMSPAVSKAKGKANAPPIAICRNTRKVASLRPWKAQFPADSLTLSWIGIDWWRMVRERRAAASGLFAEK